MSIKKTINNQGIIGYSADVDPQYGSSVVTDHKYNLHVRRSGSDAGSSDKIGWAVSAKKRIIGTQTRTIIGYSAPHADLGGESNRGCMYLLTSSYEKSVGENGSTTNRFASSEIPNTLILTASLSGYPASSNNNGATRKIGSGESTWGASSEYVYRFNAVDSDIVQKGSNYYARGAAGSPNHYCNVSKGYDGGVHVWDTELGQTGTRVIKEFFITSSVMTTGDGFGAAVCCNTNDYGSYVLIGSPEYDSGSINSTGMVSFYKWDNASETHLGPTTINYPFGSQIGGHFGTSIAGDGTLVAIGSPGYDRAVAYRQHAVYGFTKKTTLVHPSASSSGVTKFGTSVAVSGNYIAVGAPYDSGSVGKVHSNAAGRVFIYKGNESDEFSLEFEVAPTGDTAENRNSFYGMSVALDDDGYLIVGNGSYGGFSNSYPGRVYIYKSGSSGWSEVKSIDRLGTNTYVYFGSSVAAAGGMLVASGHGDHTTTDSSGDETGIANIYDVNQITTTNDVGRIFRFSAKTINNIRGNSAGTDIKTIIGD